MAFCVLYRFLFSIITQTGFSFVIFIMAIFQSKIVISDSKKNSPEDIKKTSSRFLLKSFGKKFSMKLSDFLSLGEINLVFILFFSLILKWFCKNVLSSKKSVKSQIKNLKSQIVI